MMSLSEYAKRLVIWVEGSHDAGDMVAVRDEIIRPFVIFARQEQELLDLKKRASWDTLAVGLISGREEKISHNKDVLDRLEKAVGELGLHEYSLTSLRQKQQECVLGIRTTETDAADEIRAYSGAAARLGDLDLARNHPEVVRVREARDRKIAQLQVEYDNLGEKIKKIENILADFIWW